MLAALIHTFEAAGFYFSKIPNPEIRLQSARCHQNQILAVQWHGTCIRSKPSRHLPSRGICVSDF